MLHNLIIMEDNVITNLPSIKLIQDIHDLIILNTNDEISRYTLRRYFFQQINQINGIPVCAILFFRFIDALQFDIYYSIASKVVGLNHEILYRSNSYASDDSMRGFTDCLYDLYKNCTSLTPAISGTCCKLKNSPDFASSSVL